MEDRKQELMGLKKEELVEMIIALEAKKSKGPRIKNVQYSVTEEVAENGFSGLPPQAVVLLKLIQEAGKPVKEIELREMVAENREELKTKQDPWRIFQFYRPRLINEDYLRMEEIPAE